MLVLTRIWERYFCREFLQTFFFVLICFYGLYALIDYSSHSANFHKHQVGFQWLEVFIYYACEFIRRMDVLIPFVTIIASIRTLGNLNTHYELVALMSSGLSLRRLMVPFILIGLFLTGFGYIGTEVLTPIALKKQAQIDQDRKLHKRKKHELIGVQNLSLKEQGTLVFQSYDPERHLFDDAFWVRNIDEVHHMTTLQFYPELNLPPKGTHVQSFQRDAKGLLTLTDVQEQKSFPQIHFQAEELFEAIRPPEAFSIKELWQNWPQTDAPLSEKESQVVAIAYYKLISPWLGLFAVLAITPFCLRFSRQLSFFFIYAGGIFGLVTCYLTLDALVLLAKRQVLDPMWIWLPFTLLFSLILFRFVRMRTG